MIALYIFLLVLGSGMAALSIFGDILDVGGGDVGLDADLGGDVATDGSGWWKAFSLIGLVYGAMAAGATGSLLHLLWDGGQPALIGLLSAASGVTCGLLASSLLSWLHRSGSGAALAESSFEGLPAIVTLPIREAHPGRIRIQRGSREHVLRALPFAHVSEGFEAGIRAEIEPEIYPAIDPAIDPCIEAGMEADTEAGVETWTQVVVVEVRAGIAYVTPAGPEIASS